MIKLRLPASKPGKGGRVVLGVVLALLGLALALYQIRKAERAALAAKRSADAAITQGNTYTLLLSIPELALLEREIDWLANWGDQREILKALRDWQARSSELVGLLKERLASDAEFEVKVQESVALATQARGLVSKDPTKALKATERFRARASQVVDLARQEGARVRATLPEVEPVPTFTDDLSNLWNKVRGK